MILAGDIGGTSTRLAQFNEVDGNLNRLSMEVYPSRDHSNLSEILRIYCKQHPADIALACLGIAAPVDKGVARTPNLPWHVSEAELQRDSGLSQVRLINDLEANAWGIGGLGEDDFCVLNEVHEKVSGNQAVISAGTGLGEAGLYWDGYSYHPFACEGGHADFAPCNELQVELLAYLNRINGGHVSFERVVSGPGLKSIYEFLRDTGRGVELPRIAEKMDTNEASAAISEAAIAHACPLCEQALDLFVSVYAAEAGNLALKLKATGGVYLGGGIAPKILPALRRPEFIEAFIAKGRMQSLLERIPVKVVLNPDTALLGSARCAASMTGLLHV